MQRPAPSLRERSGAVQQLILMALSDNEVVVQQACKILGGLQYPSSSLPMVAHIKEL